MQRGIDPRSEIVDTTCAIRSTETAFHATIDLRVVVNGLPHH